ncbi:MAG: NUDIX domain-containing protein [Chloroflexota bacterium]
MARAAAILIEDGKVALIERRRAGKLYYLFPGGGTEYGEWPTETVIREVEEELGLVVRVNRLIAEVIFRGRPQYFFLVERLSGEFGTGQGPEMGNSPQSPSGSFTPVWMPIEQLPELIIHPLSVVEMVLRSRIESWPEEAPRFYEKPDS